MNIEVIFYTQVVSIVGYLLAIFYLYRLLVSQKDAVIELLNQKIDFLKLKITQLETQAPDVLLSALAKRVEISQSESPRVSWRPVGLS